MNATMHSGKQDALAGAGEAAAAVAVGAAPGLLHNSSSSKALVGALAIDSSLKQHQAPAAAGTAAAAAAGGTSWSIAAGCEADDAADHCSGSDDGCSSSSTDLDKNDEQQQLKTDATDPAAAIAWLGEPPPAAWLSGAGSYRLALNTSSKHGAGTRTRVSQ
jgi:hypothetical protein